MKDKDNNVHKSNPDNSDYPYTETTEEAYTIEAASQEIRKDMEEVYISHVNNSPNIHRPIESPPRSGRISRGFLAILLIIGVFALGGGLGMSVTNNQWAKDNQAIESQIKELQADNETLSQQVASLFSQQNNSLDTTEISTNLTNHSVTNIIDLASPSVVSINTTATNYNWFNQLYTTPSAGSGIVFDENDEKIFVVTNYHVVEQAQEATISFDDTVQIPAHYIGGAKEMDLAVIGVFKSDLKKADINDVPVAVFADSDKVKTGDAAIAIGNALGQGKSATYGIISAENRSITTKEGTEVAAFQTDAAINEGNSGGALVDENGHVIGVNTAKLASTTVEGMGFAIPSNVVVEIATEIISTGKVEKPYIGIDHFPITDQLLQSYNFPSKGIYVNAVYQNSTAHVAGLQAGDIITSIDGKTVLTSEEVAEIINKSHVGDTMTFQILRSNRFNQAEEFELSAPIQNATTDPSF